MTLHVFQNDVVDSFVAESAEEARQLGIEYAKEFGVDGETYEDPEMVYDQVDDDKTMTINMEDDDGGKQTHTASEWCAINGKGFLCSTEY